MLNLIFTVALAATAAMASPTLAPRACNQVSGQRTCGIGGDRVLACLSDPVCPVDFPNSPFDATNEAANQASCAGLAEGAACTAVWSCCNSD